MRAVAEESISDAMAELSLALNRCKKLGGGFGEGYPSLVLDRVFGPEFNVRFSPKANI